MVVKTRMVDHTGILRYSQLVSGSRQTYNGSPVRSEQRTVTSNHSWPPSEGSLRDVGGSFFTTGVTDFEIDWSNVKTPEVFGAQYSGPQFPFSPHQGVLDVLKDSYIAALSDSRMDAYGTTAIANCIPTNPIVDGVSSLVELGREGIPSIPFKALAKSKFKSAKEYGNEYLNANFGWLPLVSDIQKAAKATIESEKILKQLHRDSGKPVRRQYEFPSESITRGGDQVGTRYSWTPSAQSTWLYNGGGKLTIMDELSTKTWFSGSFTYHLPDNGTGLGKLEMQAAEARKLYGVEFTPETLWNLLPWSWLVDYGTNTGDIIHNLTRFMSDKLVMNYGYLMRQSSIKRTYTLSGGCLIGGPGQLNMSITATTKQRRPATPYGFGFNMDGLSGRQQAILAALGLSRRK